MSELVTQWSDIMAFLGDEMSEDGITNYSNSLNLTPEQLMAMNTILVEIVESGGKLQGPKDKFVETLYDEFKIDGDKVDFINDKLILFVESLDTHPDDKDELLTIMRDYDPNGMSGGKKTKKSRKTKNSRKIKKSRKTRRPRRK
jgi:hypothetical protein